MSHSVSGHSAVFGTSNGKGSLGISIAVNDVTKKGERHKLITCVTCANNMRPKVHALSHQNIRAGIAFV